MERSIFIPERYNSNICHFLLLSLAQMRKLTYIPDAIYINLLKKDFKEHNFIYDLLHMMYPNSKIIDVVSCPPGCPSLDPKFDINLQKENSSLDDFIFLNKHIIPHLDTYIPTKKYSNKIFISRRDATCRKILNESDLTSVLESEGFESVVLGGLHILEQISIFRNADIVIGTHGANLTNSMFCKPGTRIIEISTDYMAKNAPHYQWIANTMELNHKFYIDTSEVLENYNRMYNNFRIENPHSILNMI
jgi:capsular polysaccharide biosynthesis protein